MNERDLTIVLHNPSEAYRQGWRTCPCTLCQWGLDLENMWELGDDDPDMSTL